MPLSSNSAASRTAAMPWGRCPTSTSASWTIKYKSTGLQIADLVAHPIGRHVIDPTQENRAYARIEPKFRRSPQGRVQGYGLKVFP